jgi:hypothetical protein
VCDCDFETSTMRRPWPTKAVGPWGGWGDIIEYMVLNKKILDYHIVGTPGTTAYPFKTHKGLTLISIVILDTQE